MISRIAYAIRMAWRYRQTLAVYCHDSSVQISSIFSLDLEAIKASGIQVMVLDFDGVLSAHGEAKPSEDVAEWLRHCLAIFGEEKVFILTNKPAFKRWDYCIQNFKGIRFLTSPRKKPYPDGVIEILSSTQASPNEVAVVDDRLLTGILAAIIAGTKALYVMDPLVNLSKRPIQELFFMMLRRLDRLVVWLFEKL